MHFCLIDCFDAGFFLSFFLFPAPLFCFRRGAEASRSPDLMTRTWWAFSFTQQEPSGGSFDGKKSHWRPEGPHRPPFMHRHHHTSFLIGDKKWVRRESNVKAIQCGTSSVCVRVCVWPSLHGGTL